MRQPMVGRFDGYRRDPMVFSTIPLKDFLMVEKSSDHKPNSSRQTATEVLPATSEQESSFNALELFAKFGGFGGLVLFVFLTLYSRFADLKPIFGQLTAQETYSLLMTFMYLTFGLCVFGLVCYVFLTLQSRNRRATVQTLVILLAALVIGGATWATNGKIRDNVDISMSGPSARAQNANVQPTQTSQPSPLPKAGVRTLVAGNLGFSVDGCKSRGQQFAATANGEVDRDQGGQGGAPHGFDLEVTGNNGHGVRNITVKDNTISFEAFADGPGTNEGMLGCVGAQGANVNVNVYAYIRP